MDLPLTPARSLRSASESRASLWRRLARAVRYRFFLFAGLLPYLLGGAWAYAHGHRIDVAAFWMALAGVGCAVVGVEAFNEYFDAWLGTDRVFDRADAPRASRRVLALGSAAFAAALAVGLYLTARAGWPLLVFALLGGAAAIFYEAPPIRWSYRGWGEAVIGLSYGPGLVLGSVYLQTHRLAWDALWASLLPGLLIAALAVANAIPDYQQDRLVGKRNLVVRLGRRRGVWLYLALGAMALLSVITGVIAGVFPVDCLGVLLALPALVMSGRYALAYYESPRRLAPAIRCILVCYILSVTLFVVALWLPTWWAPLPPSTRSS